MARVQRYTFPDHPLPIPLATALLALPGEIQTGIFLYLSIDDLSVLSRCVDELKGLDLDNYLRRVWYSSVSHPDPEPYRYLDIDQRLNEKTQTVPARLDFALFSNYNARPDVHELVSEASPSQNPSR